MQLSDWFMIRHAYSRRVCTCTYVLPGTKYVRTNVLGEDKKHPPEVRSLDGHFLYNMCAKVQVHLQ